MEGILVMPAALVIVPLVIAAVGAVASSAMTHQQARTQRKLTDVNAKNMEFDAKAKQRDAANAAHSQRAEGERLLARQRALYGAAGVDVSSGSPLMLQVEQAGQIELQAQRTLYEGERQALKLNTEAELMRWSAKKNERLAKKGLYISVATGAGAVAGGAMAGSGNGQKTNGATTSGLGAHEATHAKSFTGTGG